MAGVPISFPIPGENAIASYSSTEIATSTGLVKFYAGDSISDNSGAAYFLTNNDSYYSASGAIRAVQAISTYSFPVEFRRPFLVKGIMHLNIPSLLYTTSVETVASVIIANINKIDLDNATTILYSGAVTHSFVFNPAGTDYKMLGLSYNLAQTSFKIGEKIELKMYNSKTTGGGNAQAWIGCDPANRTNIAPGLTSAWTNGARLTLGLPTRIEL